MKKILSEPILKSVDKNYYWTNPLLTLLTPSLILKIRSSLYSVIAKNITLHSKYKVLDLGATDKDDNYFHKLYPFKRKLTVAGIPPTNYYISNEYPEIQYIQVSDKFPYQFKNHEFDFVHSSAVIEHVGSRKRQEIFLKELKRIGKNGVVTTPNRWFPLEFHTLIPFINWLPTKIYRKIFKLIGFSFLADEKNLNLLTFHDFENLITKAGFKKFKIVRKRTLGITSNFLLFWYS